MRFTATCPQGEVLCCSDSAAAGAAARCARCALPQEASSRALRAQRHLTTVMAARLSVQRTVRQAPS